MFPFTLCQNSDRRKGQGRGLGREKNFLCKVSVLERKQDFIKILAEHQLVPISKALGESFPFTLCCFSFPELHMLFPKTRRFWPRRFIQLGRCFIFQKCRVHPSCSQKLQCLFQSLVGLGDQVPSIQAGWIMRGEESQGLKMSSHSN